MHNHFGATYIALIREGSLFTLQAPMFQYKRHSKIQIPCSIGRWTAWLRRKVRWIRRTFELLVGMECTRLFVMMHWASSGHIISPRLKIHIKQKSSFVKNDSLGLRKNKMFSETCNIVSLFIVYPLLFVRMLDDSLFLSIHVFSLHCLCWT